MINAQPQNLNIGKGSEQHSPEISTISGDICFLTEIVSMDIAKAQSGMTRITMNKQSFEQAMHYCRLSVRSRQIAFDYLVGKMAGADTMKKYEISRQHLYRIRKRVLQAFFDFEQDQSNPDSRIRKAAQPLFLKYSDYPPELHLLIATYNEKAVSMIKETGMTAKEGRAFKKGAEQWLAIFMDLSKPADRAGEKNINSHHTAHTVLRHSGWNYLASLGKTLPGIWILRPRIIPTLKQRKHLMNAND